jgi:hypothetical protein
MVRYGGAVSGSNIYPPPDQVVDPRLMGIGLDPGRIDTFRPQHGLKLYVDEVVYIAGYTEPEKVCRRPQACLPIFKSLQV